MIYQSKFHEEVKNQMSNESAKLYSLKAEDIKTASTMLAKAFFHDPVWVHVMPDTDERNEKLPIAFEFLLKYASKYGEIYASSHQLEGVVALLPHDKIKMTFWRILRSGAFKVGIGLGQEIGNRIQKAFDPIDKDREELMGNKPYLYIQAIGVDPEFQGKGFGTKLMKSTFAIADKKQISIYLETETKQNLLFYKKLNFTVLKEQSLLGTDFIYWAMLRDPQ